MNEAPVFPTAPLPWHQPCWDKLLQQIEQDRFPHAILLQGVADSDIEGFALLLSQYLLCESPRTGLPCGVCRSCHFYKAGSHPDFEYLTLEPTEKGDKLSRFIRIDQVREIIDTVHQTAMHSARKVLVIFPAESMNAAAANALLKSLEEPPAGTVFLLASNHPSRLMATIRSRCQMVHLALPPPPQAEEWLKPWLADLHKRQSLLAMAGQNPLLVKQWLDRDAVDQVLDITADLEQLRAGRCSPLQLAAQWQKAGVANRLLWWWRWLAQQLRQETEANTMVAQRLRFMDKLLQARRQLDSTANPSEILMLESLLIDWHNSCS